MAAPCRVLTHRRLNCDPETVLEIERQIFDRSALQRASDSPILNPSLPRVKRPLTLTLFPEYRGEGTGGFILSSQLRSPSFFNFDLLIGELFLRADSVIVGRNQTFSCQI